jgi:hypothetical protein
VARLVALSSVSNPKSFRFERLRRLDSARWDDKFSVIPTQHLFPLGHTVKLTTSVSMRVASSASCLSSLSFAQLSRSTFWRLSR